MAAVMILYSPFYSCVLSDLALSESEAGVDFALIQTSVLFRCKPKLFSILKNSMINI